MPLLFAVRIARDVPLRRQGYRRPRCTVAAATASWPTSELGSSRCETSSRCHVRTSGALLSCGVLICAMSDSTTKNHLVRHCAGLETYDSVQRGVVDSRQTPPVLSPMVLDALTEWSFAERPTRPSQNPPGNQRIRKVGTPRDARDPGHVDTPGARHAWTQEVRSPAVFLNSPNDVFR